MNTRMPISRVALPALVIVVVLCCAAGCVQNPRTPPGTPSYSEYAFIDHHTYIDGKTTSGTYPAIMIDFPTYRFDPDTGDLEGLVTFDLNPSLVVIVGSGASLTGAYGSGAASMLHGGYHLPFASDDVVVNGFAADGTVHLSYGNLTLALQPGERLTDISTVTEQTRDYSINKTVTDTITYYGIFPKSNIKANIPR
jgi:hypothetical protein